LNIKNAQAAINDNNLKLKSLKDDLNSKLGLSNAGSTAASELGEVISAYKLKKSQLEN
jgi:hypothetical protein